MANASLSRIARRFRRPASAAADHGAAQLPEQARWHFCDESVTGQPPDTPPRCGICGRTLLTGEQVRVFLVEERHIEVCPLCATQLSGHGFTHAA